MKNLLKVEMIYKKLFGTVETRDTKDKVDYLKRFYC